MTKLNTYGVLIGLIGLLIGSYNLGLRNGDPSNGAAKPTVLILCMGVSDVAFTHCASSPLELKTGAECEHAMDSASYVIQAAQRLHVVQGNALTVACLPKSDFQRDLRLRDAKQTARVPRSAMIHVDG